MPAVFKEPLNLGRFETWNTHPGVDLFEVKQVHGTDIATPETLASEADGIMVGLESPWRPIAIKTADCLPIVVEGAQGVVMLHAGWRGLALGILRRPEVALVRPLRAFIGPAIHACCYEVSRDFRENFPKSPRSFIERDGKLFFDLRAEALAQLKELFPDLPVTSAEACTSCTPELHSYRRGKGTQDRNWNLYIKG
jgi:copper oxidase (laccase) domain-containing protein